MTLYAASGRSIRAQNAPRGGFNLTPEDARRVEAIFVADCAQAARDGDTATVVTLRALILDMNAAIQQAEASNRAANIKGEAA